MSTKGDGFCFCDYHQNTKQKVSKNMCVTEDKRIAELPNDQAMQSELKTERDKAQKISRDKMGHATNGPSWTKVQPKKSTKKEQRVFSFQQHSTT